ncbi:MAG: glycosyltransferase [Thermoleophilaceae bacterium]|nr:glycosyltransferase [Thermoleophilaceae bacterium]
MRDADTQRDLITVQEQAGGHRRTGVCEFDIVAPVEDFERTLDELVRAGYSEIRLLVLRAAVVLGEMEFSLPDADTAAAAKSIARAVNAHYAGQEFREIAPATATAMISVAVPTRGELQVLSRCLKALSAQDHSNFEVLVCDNRPEEAATRLLVEEHARSDSRVRWIPAFERGSSAARNAGLRAAAGEIVAFADDDTIPSPNWLSTVASVFEGDASACCVTGLVLPSAIDTDAQRWFESRGAYLKGYVRRTFSLENLEDHGPLFPFEVGVYGTGANFAFRRDFLASIGGFDTSLGIGTPSGGGEDLDLFLSTLFAGGRIVYEPSAYVRHPSHSQNAELVRQMHGYGSGLSAVLAKRAVVGPGRKRLLAVLPLGVVHLLRGFHKANGVELRSIDSSAILGAEIRGVFLGPARWLAGCISKRSRARAGIARRREFELTTVAAAPRALKVIHVNVAPRTKASVDGIRSALAAQVEALIAAGNEVTVMGGDAVAGPEVSSHVPADGVLEAIRAMRAELRRGKPDIVHIHSLFRPAHVVLGWMLRRASVPYVVQPHSALGPRALRRYRLRKLAWMFACERRFIGGAAAIICLTEAERREVHAVDSSKTAAVVPNPLAKSELAASCRWTPPRPGDASRPRAVTLCRFDVTQKGLDRIARYAALVPEMDFVVHGQADHNEPELLKALRADLPPNMSLAAPVQGDAKRAALSTCSIYLQPSRWEGLSISVCEAFSLGAPVAVSSELGESLPARLAAASLVLDPDFDVAAGQLRAFLEAGPDFERLADAERWVGEAMSPSVVAAELASVYMLAAKSAK